MPKGEHYEPTPEDYAKAEEMMTGKEPKIGPEELSDRDRQMADETTIETENRESILAKAIEAEKLRNEAVKEVLDLGLGREDRKEEDQRIKNHEKMIEAKKLAFEVLDSSGDFNNNPNVCEKFSEEEWEALYTVLNFVGDEIYLEELKRVFGDKEGKDEWFRKRREIIDRFNEEDMKAKFGSPKRFVTYHKIIGSSTFYNPNDPVFDYPGELSIFKELMRWYNELKSLPAKE